MESQGKRLPFVRRTGFLALAALAALAAVALSCHAAEAKCRAPVDKPKVRLNMLMGELEVNHDLGRDRIKALSDKVIGHVQGPWHVPLGLTHSATSARYETAFTYSRDRGMYCVSLTKAEISVGLVELTVYVSNEYARGTCQYEAIHAHEMDHVKRNREVMKRYQERIRKALSRVLRAKRVIRVYNKAEARSAYILAFQRAVKPLLRDLIAEQGRANARIDTERSYRAIFAQCPEW